jgi:hypothetical protein
LERLHEKVGRFLADVSRNEVLNGYGFYLSLEVRFSFGSPRSLSCQHFVENDSDSPKVALTTVNVIIKGLQGHIDGGSDIVIARFLEI